MHDDARSMKGDPTSNPAGSATLELPSPSNTIYDPAQKTAKPGATPWPQD
jgi:hypothetical protein